MQRSARSRRLGLDGMVRTAWNAVGRRRREVSNPRRMTCELARDELSAQLDGEQSPSLTTTLAEHLPGCTDCRNWQEAAHQITRRVRLTSARPIPDRSAWRWRHVLNVPPGRVSPDQGVFRPSRSTSAFVAARSRHWRRNASSSSALRAANRPGLSYSRKRGVSRFATVAFDAVTTTHITSGIPN
jgi:hypothetical protein